MDALSQLAEAEEAADAAALAVADSALLIRPLVSDRHHNYLSRGLLNEDEALRLILQVELVILDCRNESIARDNFFAVFFARAVIDRFHPSGGGDSPPRV